MLLDRSQFRDHRLSSAERRNWRFVMVLGGAAILMLAYLLPFFDTRITAATTAIQENPGVELSFPVLIHGQHPVHAKALRNGTLQSVDLTLEPVKGVQSTGLGWLARAVASRDAALASFAITMALPLVAALLALALVLRSWTRERGIAEALLPLGLALGAASVASLLLAWQHQFDFSSYLLQVSGGSLTPAWGFWLAVAGAVVLTLGLWSLRYETRRALLNWWALAFAVALIIWLLVRVRPYPYLEIWNFISDGIVVTLRIVVISYGFILLVSLLGGLGRISHNRIIYGVASLYVEIIRGIPLLVQLLFIWFALPNLFRSLGEAALRLPPQFGGLAAVVGGLRLNEYTAAVLGLTICYGAYGAEIFRAGISSIHHGQMEAARSLGMSSFQAMRHVVLPQAVRVILPPIGNEFVALIKDSSLVSVLAVSDLTRRGREYMARTFLSFDTWIMVALCYLVLTLVSSRIVEFLEAKTRFER
ncbi:MAG: amino acid ABC transporter permease [Anaerolineae bacterium]